MNRFLAVAALVGCVSCGSVAVPQGTLDDVLVEVNPGGQATLQRAIDSLSPAGGTVRLTAGVYTDSRCP